MLTRCFKYSALLLACYFCHSVYAGITVDRTIIDFPAGQPPRQDVVISNQSDDTAYVSVEVLEVLDPGTDKEIRQAVDNLKSINFVASPSKVVIPAKGKKQVRLVNLKPSDSEQVYRINFTPVEAPLANQEGMGVRILIAYQVLALIQPDKPEENLQFERNGKQLTITNKGNSYALVSDFLQCDS